MLPLKNVRILDLTRVLAGPLATQMLGDLGAEIIKIERPDRGDDSRGYGPPYLPSEDGKPARDNAFYLSANRNKRSVTVNIATAEGQALIRELASECDVLVENYKVGDLKRYGLDYEAIRAVNPGIIYCSITGFGQTGPYRHRLGYDSVFQAMSGLMEVTGLPDDEPGGGPMKVGPSIVDVLTGLNASNAIVSALYGRDVNGGPGQHIDLALMDAGVAALSHFAQVTLVSGDEVPRRGTAGNGGTPSQMFRCSDGGLMLTAGTDGQFARLCAVLGLDGMADDPRFATNNARLQNKPEMLAALDAAFATDTTAAWLAKLDTADVPAGPIYTIGQMFADPQVQARGLRVEAAHPVAGQIGLIANPIRYSETPISGYSAPPLLGADTDDVLTDLLGHDAEKIARLRDAGAI